jgi:hypothetical protein
LATNIGVGKTMRKRKIFILLLLLPLVLLSLPGCVSAPSSPVKVQISFSELPILGKPVQLTATFKLTQSRKPVVQDVTTCITLPEGFEKVDGDLEWKGDFIPGNTYTLSARVKAVKTGAWKIEAQASSGKSVGGYTDLWVEVTEAGATISDAPPHKEGPKQIPTEPWQIPSPFSGGSCN